MRATRRWVAVVVGAALAGCGSSDNPASAPPPATPAVSPAPAATPAGTVRAFPGAAQALILHTEGDTLALTTAAPDRTTTMDAATLRPLRREPDERPLTPQVWRRLQEAARLETAFDGRVGGGIRLDPKARTLTYRGETVAAGIGPTAVVAGDGGRVYVTDTGGHAVLLFRTRPELKLVRRVGLDGSPYGTALDEEKGKLWVTLTDRNEAVQLSADGLPRVQRRFPTVRQPDVIDVDDRTGRVFVLGRYETEVQAFAGYPPRPAD